MKRGCFFAMLSLGIGLLVLGLSRATPGAAQEVTPKDLEDQAKQFTRTAETIPMPEALAFQTGSNQWAQHEPWPPEDGCNPQALIPSEWQAGSLTACRARGFP